MNHFDLLCKDGSRKPLSEFRTCNWGEAPTNAIVVSSATSIDDRLLYQKFLDKISEIYKNTSLSGTPYNNNYDDNQPAYDAFGNRVARQTYTDYNRNGFGGSPADYDPYNNRQNGPNLYGNYDNNRNPYGDPFGQDPNIFNPNRYGVNIDPYGPVKNEFDGTNDLQPSVNYDDEEIQLNDTAKYEYFTFFESVPRFGNQSNLMFQVCSHNFFLVYVYVFVFLF